MIVKELEELRQLANHYGGLVEPWQLTFLSVGSTLIFLSILSFLCQEEPLIQRVKTRVFKTMRVLPFIGAKIKNELKLVNREMYEAPFAPKPGEEFVTELPKQGSSKEKILKRISGLGRSQTAWKDGKVSGTVYNGSKELTELATNVFSMTSWANNLHPGVFPETRKLEAEAIKMCCSMFNGGPSACGVMTAGGTESILMAMKAYREMGYERGIEKPEIICAKTAHCAFDKAAGYFNMKIVHVPVDKKSGKCNVKAMSRAISSSTIVLVGSGPSYPHGIIDPIEEIAALARKKGIFVHVDCCLGGFVLPFMDDAGFPIAPFDFRVKGVTSISCDTHKYGFAPKGSSVVLYADMKLRQYQYFVATDWPGGIYASPSVAGSRPGALASMAWATMMYMGREGYVDAARKMITTARYIESEMRKMEGIFVFGKPEVTVIGFGSNEFDIYRLSNFLSERGWHINPLQFPSSVHFCVTMCHTKDGVADNFLKDLREGVSAVLKAPKDKATGTGALYGTAQTIPDRSLVKDIANIYLDLCYSTKSLDN